MCSLFNEKKTDTGNFIRGKLTNRKVFFYILRIIKKNKNLSGAVYCVIDTSSLRFTTIFSCLKSCLPIVMQRMVAPTAMRKPEPQTTETRRFLHPRSHSSSIVEQRRFFNGHVELLQILFLLELLYIFKQEIWTMQKNACRTNFFKNFVASEKH